MKLPIFTVSALAAMLDAPSISAFVPSPHSTRSTSAVSTSTQQFFKVDGKTIEGGIEQFKPTNNMMLIKKTGALDTTEGGLFLTGKAKEKKSEGTVIAVGPGKTHESTGTYFPMPVEIGDLVVYPKAVGTELDMDGAKHLLIQDDDIFVRYPNGGPSTIEVAEVIRDNVLVAIEKKSETASEFSGILLAKSSNSEKKPSSGTVVKVGPGRQATNGEMMPMEVEIGDMIKFRDFAGASVEIDDKEYSVVRMVDIVAKY